MNNDQQLRRRLLEKQFGSSARECRSQLYLQPEPPAHTGETQTFATEEIGKDWLSAFWSEYSSIRSE